MEKFESKQIENRENFGENVEMRILINRHAKYEKESGLLSNQGQQEAQNKGSAFVPSGEGEQYLLKGYSSEFPRTQQTVENIVGAINTERKGKTRVNWELGGADEDFFIGDLNGFLEKGKVKINDKLITSKELAKRVAERIDTFARMSERLKSGSKVDLVNITHLPWIMSFLKEIAGEELSNINPEGKNFIEKIGGIVGYLEGFEIILRRNKEDVNITLKFRDREITLPYEKLRELLDKHDYS